MKRDIPTFALCLLLALCPIFILAAQDADPGLREIRQGIDFYKISNFSAALGKFTSVLKNPAFKSAHGDAFFWSAKSAAALGRYDEAAKNIEHFLKNFPRNPYFPEGLYEKGRLLHLQGEHEAAIVVLQDFLAAYPDSEYAANAYYWMGESLFALGEFKSAERMFSTVTTRYPTSFRAEAARFRAELIGLKYREEELLKLLKWSHEEHLKALEESGKNETAYAEALKAYQQKLSALQVKDSESEVLRLTEKVNALEEQLRTARNPTDAATTGGTSAVSGEDWSGRVKVLEAKAEALKLKEYYLERLIKEYEGKRK